MDGAAPAQSEEGVVVELSRFRHAMWRAMVKSLRVLHFSYSVALDITCITDLHAFLPMLNAHIPAHYLSSSPSPSSLSLSSDKPHSSTLRTPSAFPRPSTSTLP
ncbi:hypothetical protein B0H19DRAFT_525101 [Mycena capillaripes]|nr:hypothetical protein B0H19DRAFT_525101 [Mycena capillaripes]